MRGRDVALRGYVDALVRKLSRLMPIAVEGADVEAVHDARVAARRMKGALDLLGPIVGESHLSRLQKSGRRIRKRLGELRDLDVMLGHLRRLSKLHGHTAAAVWLSERLMRRRADAVRQLRKRASAHDWTDRLAEWKKIRGQIAVESDALDRAMHSALAQQTQTFAGQADRLCGQMLDSLFTQERDPHAVRIAGKQLRYTLEMLAKTGDQPLAETRKIFKRMQDALGLWHDFVVLSDAAMREAADSEIGHSDPALAGQVMRLGELTLRRSEHYLQRFATLWRLHREAVMRLDAGGNGGGAGGGTGPGTARLSS